jgi:hypothetical protein
MIAVTCVAGNVGLEPVLNNARRILELAGRQDVRWLHRRRYADGAEDILLEEAKQAIAATEGEIGARGRTRRLPLGGAESIGWKELGLAGCRSGTALYQRAARILSGGHVERSPFQLSARRGGLRSAPSIPPPSACCLRSLRALPANILISACISKRHHR